MNFLWISLNSMESQWDWPNSSSFLLIKQLNFEGMEYSKRILKRRLELLSVGVGGRLTCRSNFGWITNLFGQFGFPSGRLSERTIGHLVFGYPPTIVGVVVWVYSHFAFCSIHFCLSLVLRQSLWSSDTLWRLHLTSSYDPINISLLLIWGLIQNFWFRREPKRTKVILLKNESLFYFAFLPAFLWSTLFFYKRSHVTIG